MSTPHGLTGKAYAPTVALALAIIADIAIGFVVWRYSSWDVALTCMIVAAVFLSVLFIGIFGEGLEN